MLFLNVVLFNQRINKSFMILILIHVRELVSSINRIINTKFILVRKIFQFDQLKRYYSHNTENPKLLFLIELRYYEYFDFSIVIY